MTQIEGKNILSDELGKIAREKRQHLENWLACHKEASPAAPTVERAWELAKWEENALINAPAEVCFDPVIERQMSNELTLWQSALPQMPQYNHDQIRQVYTSSFTSGSAMYTQISKTSQQLQDPEIEQWSTQYTERYETIQHRHNRREEVLKLLGSLNPERVEEFEKACEACESVQGGWLSQEDAGIAMRNVLEHVKGDLWQVAKRPHEQKFKWPIMVDRLSKTGPGTHMYQTLLDEETKHRQLHTELTHVAKNMKSVSGRDVVVLMTRLQDHLFIVLSSIEL